jgi:ribonucleoside-diphosphate reductase alpha chain
LGGVFHDNFGYIPQSTSNIVREYIAENNLGEPTRDLVREYSSKLRADKGADYLVNTAINNVDESNVVVLTGLYAVPEALYVRKIGGAVVRIAADEDVRLQRMRDRQRSGESGAHKEFKRLNDVDLNSHLSDQRLSDVLRMADFTINGNIHISNEDRILMEAKAAVAMIEMMQYSNKYRSYFYLNDEKTDFLSNGKVKDPEEHPYEMTERIVSAILKSDEEYKTNDSDIFAVKLGKMLDEKEVVFSTPIMTNAGRYEDKPLTACTVPAIDIENGNWDEIERKINELHKKGMGTGYNLDNLKDPIGTLDMLNTIAALGAESGEEDRPVGNMAVMSVYDKNIFGFIDAKSVKLGELWKFNLSVNIDDGFIDAVTNEEKIALSDGSVCDANKIFDKICSSALKTGEPGLVFLDRMNQRNPARELGDYHTVAPCGEVGLVNGETCQFAYINLSKFISDEHSLDVEKLKEVSRVLTRALDDALDISHKNLEIQSKNIIEQKRKIGIGLCGVADTLAILGLRYDSQEARDFMEDAYALINYSSKLESVKLAKTRGSCGLIKDGKSEYLKGDGYLDRRYSDNPTRYVSSKDWRELSNTVKEEKKLRNISTTSLPPTGRSAIIVGASTGIEPYFNEGMIDDEIVATIKNSDSVIYANSIKPLDHIKMTAALQTVCDESIAKTINMYEGTTLQEVRDAMLAAYKYGLNGITIFVDKSLDVQPIILNKEGENDDRQTYV